VIPTAGLLRSQRPDPRWRAGPELVAGSKRGACRLAGVNGRRPKRWVVCCNANTKAWGLFWAGGGLHRCRQDLLVDTTCALRSAPTDISGSAQSCPGDRLGEAGAEARPQSCKVGQSLREGQAKRLLLRCYFAQWLPLEFCGLFLLNSPWPWLWPCWALSAGKHFLGSAAGTGPQVGAAAERLPAPAVNR